jgi:8-oxo-dGTP diphosphatase
LTHHTVVPTTEYVAGFLFANGGYAVVLIRKEKPAWQAGLLNAVGGKIEPNETPEQAMRREFIEEAGVDVDSWKKFCVLQGEGFRVHFFSTFDTAKYNAVQSCTNEQVIRTYIDRIKPSACLPNVIWLISMALAMDRDRADHFVIEERYQ